MEEHQQAAAVDEPAKNGDFSIKNPDLICYDTWKPTGDTLVHAIFVTRHDARCFV